MTIKNENIHQDESVVLVTNSTAFNIAGSQLGMHIANMYENHFIIKVFHADGSTQLPIAAGGKSQFNFIIL